MRFWLVLAAWLVTIPYPLLSAHEGHNHEAAQPSQPLQAADHGRIVARTKAFDMVATLRGHDITVYLDGSENNDPVAGAVVTIEGVGHTVTAKQTDPGTYVADAEWIDTPGAYAFTITVVAAHERQQFTGTLGPAAPAAAKRGVSIGPRSIAIAVIGFGIALAAFRAGRRRWGGTALGFAIIASLLTGSAKAHDGEHAAVPPADEAIPHRHANGSVFMSKPTQRLVGIRTLIAVESDTAPSIEIAGRVIADPNRSGRAPATRDGRIDAGPNGFPHLGQRVGQGEVLAYLIPTLSSSEEATLKQALVQIERDMALLVPRADAIATVNPNMPMGEATASALEELQIQSQSLTRQKEVVTAALNQRIEIKAPVAGVIAAALVSLGQVVAARDPLFEIVDVSVAWVEGWSFNPVPADGIATATALTESGRTLKLKFIGSGPVLRQQAMPIVFSVDDPAATVAIGTPVRVFFNESHKIKGIVLPAAAIQRGTGHRSIVWEHSAPEVFTSHPVKVMPLDSTRVIVIGEVKAGMHLVVGGANFISQVR